MSSDMLADTMSAHVSLIHSNNGILIHHWFASNAVILFLESYFQVFKFENPHQLLTLVFFKLKVIFIERTLLVLEEINGTFQIQK